MPTVGEIAEALGATAEGDAGLWISGAAEPASAGREDLALAMQPAFAEDLGKGAARAAILWAGADWRALGLAAAVFVPRPRYALAGLTRIFDRPPEVAPGIHPSAVIDPTAEIADGAAIAPFVVIGPRTRVGPRARILAHATLAHRLSLRPEAELEGVGVASVLATAIASVPVPR